MGVWLNFYSICVIVCNLVLFSFISYEQDDRVPLVPEPVASREIAPLSNVDWNQRGDTLAFSRSYPDSSADTTASAPVIEMWTPFTSSPDQSLANPFSLADTSASIVAFSPDGMLLANLSYSNLTIFDVTSGAELVSRTGAPARFLAWSPDSKLLAVPSIAAPYALDIVDVSSRTLIEPLRFFDEGEALPGMVLTSATWLNSHELAVMGAGNRRALVNIRSGEMRQIDDCCLDGAYELVAQPDGRLIASHDRVFDAYTLDIVLSFPVQDSLIWSADGQWLVGTTLDRVSVISLTERGVVLQFTPDALGPNHAITGAAWSRDRAHIALITTIAPTESNLTRRQFASIWDMQAMISELRLSDLW